MNDMLTDTMSDDAVIARLRSALDEVAATGGPITADAPDESDASVVPLRTASPGRRPARTWIGVAAATVVLMGGAGWARSQRTAPAATGTGLDHQRVAHALGLGAQAIGALVNAVVAGNARHTGLGHAAFGVGLVAHGGHSLGRRANEHQPRVAAGAGEVGVFGQKAVAWVHCVGPGAPGRVDDGGDVQVTLARCGAANAHRQVGLAHMAAVGVGAGIHRHAAVAQGAGAAQYP